MSTMKLKIDLKLAAIRKGDNPEDYYNKMAEIEKATKSAELVLFTIDPVGIIRNAAKVKHDELKERGL